MGRLRDTCDCLQGGCLEWQVSRWEPSSGFLLAHQLSPRSPFLLNLGTAQPEVTAVTDSWQVWGLSPDCFSWYVEIVNEISLLKHCDWFSCWACKLRLREARVSDQLGQTPEVCVMRKTLLYLALFGVLEHQVMSQRWGRGTLLHLSNYWPASRPWFPLTWAGTHIFAF